MAFKKYRGLIGSIPQKFINRNLLIYPLCGSITPDWAVAYDADLVPHFNRYHFNVQTAMLSFQCRWPLLLPGQNFYYPA